MDSSYDTVNDLLTFSDSPEPKAENNVDQAISNEELKAKMYVDQAISHADAEGFNFKKFFGQESGTIDQSTELYSDDPTLNDIQHHPVYNENMNSNFTANSTSIYDSYANISSNQTAASLSAVPQPMVSSYLSILPSFQAAAQPESFVDPAPIFSPSLPSANCGPDWFDPGDGSFYPSEPELPEDFNWENQQRLEQVRFEQGIHEQVTFEQFRERQARPEYMDFDTALGKALEEQMQAALQGQMQVVRQAHRPFTEMPLLPAALLQDFQQDMNQPKNPQSDKVLKHLANAKNKRSANIAGFDPTQYYQPLPQPPQSWGGVNPRTGQPTFQYNEQGELKTTAKFTVQEINDYFSNHHLHKDIEGKPAAAKASRLTLWVQICPADSALRYGDRDASKCRFEKCPVPSNTIEKGEYRVTFDEQWWSQANTDPFHNAGHVHLYCLEKLFDFPDLCKWMNIKADTRDLIPEERKKMAITRDSTAMARIVNDFIENSVPLDGRQRPAGYYKDTLCCALTLEKLKRSPKAHKNTREKRGGNNVDVHLNNLDVLTQNAVRTKEKLDLIIIERPTPIAEQLQIRKRKSRVEEEEVGSPEPPSKKHRAMEKPSRATARLESPVKPQTLNLSRHVMGNSSEPKPPMKTSQFLKRKFQDELAAPVKRARVVKNSQFSQQDGYDTDDSGSFISPVDRDSAARRKSRGFKEEVSSFDASRHRFQVSWWRKQKYYDLEDGYKSPTEIFRHLVNEPMKRYGINKKHKKGDTAGLTTPLGDMWHLSY